MLRFILYLVLAGEFFMIPIVSSSVDLQLGGDDTRSYGVGGVSVDS